jgi:hypothetical protein
LSQCHISSKDLVTHAHISPRHISETRNLPDFYKYIAIPFLREYSAVRYAFARDKSLEPTKYFEPSMTASSGFSNPPGPTKSLAAVLLLGITHLEQLLVSDVPL